MFDSIVTVKRLLPTLCVRNQSWLNMLSCRTQRIGHPRLWWDQLKIGHLRLGTWRCHCLMPPGYLLKQFHISRKMPSSFTYVIHSASVSNYLADLPLDSLWIQPSPIAVLVINNKLNWQINSNFRRVFARLQALSFSYFLIRTSSIVQA